VEAAVDAVGDPSRLLAVAFRRRFPRRAHQIPWVRRRTVPNRTHLIVRRLRHLSY
jgi:hypothetical protein